LRKLNTIILYTLRSYVGCCYY